MELTTSALIFVGLTLLWLLYRYLTKPNEYWEKRGVPCVAETSFIQSLLVRLENKHAKDAQYVKRLGKVFGDYEFRTPTLTVADPDLLREICVKDFHIFGNHRDFSVENDMVSYMLFSARGEKWKRIRSIISPVFTTGKIKKLLPHITECAKTLSRNLSNASKDGKSVDVRKFFEAFSMDLIASSAFATKIDSHNDPQNEFVVNARRFFPSALSVRFLLAVAFPRFIKFFGISVFDPTALNFYKKVTLRIIEERRRSGEKRNDFIQLMMDSSADAESEDVDKDSTDQEDEIKDNSNGSSSKSKVLSHDELIANCVMFFLVAYGSTSMTLTMIAHALADHPECQEKIIKEVDETLKNNGNELNYDTVQGMKYMDMFVSECLRLYPIATRTERQASEDYTLGNTGIKIPKGMVVNIPVSAIHCNPEFYPEPEKFIPERFLPDEKANRNPYVYLPFGAGPRNCVGMRFALFDMKACLAYFLSQFRLKKSDKAKGPLEVYSNFQGNLYPRESHLVVQERNDKVLKDFF